MHSTVHTAVDVANAWHIFTHAADHLLSRKSDAVYIANVTAAWSERYLPDGRN
jgi:putative redox protein